MRRMKPPRTFVAPSDGNDAGCASIPPRDAHGPLNAAGAATGAGPVWPAAPRFVFVFIFIGAKSIRIVFKVTSYVVSAYSFTDRRLRLALFV